MHDWFLRVWRALTRKRESSRIHHSITAVKAAITVSTVFLISTLFPLILEADKIWRDWQTIYLHAAADPVDPVIIEIRDDVLHRRRLARLVPIDRKFIAYLTACVANAEPRAIGIDALLAGEEDSGVDQIVARQLRVAQRRAPIVIANYDVKLSGGKQVAFSPVDTLASATGVAQGNIRLQSDKRSGVVRHTLPAQFGDPLARNFSDAVLAAAGFSKPLYSVSERVFWWLPEQFTRLPAVTVADLCERNDTPSLRRLVGGRIVLLGSTAERDQHDTPLSLLVRYYKGIDDIIIHANQIANNIAGETIKEGPILLDFMLGFILALVALLIPEGYRLRRLPYQWLIPPSLLLFDSILFLVFRWSVHCGIVLFCFGGSFLFWRTIPDLFWGPKEGQLK